jgi:hypothetical protein
MVVNGASRYGAQGFGLARYAALAAARHVSRVYDPQGFHNPRNRRAICRDFVGLI